jgi:DNA-binding transcriptional LysR family regulator
MLNLRSVDLNLLPVFEAAFEEPTLTRAAERMAMTQSAVSHALSRLREVFDDELFVRRGRGLAPTPVASRIYAKLHVALGTVRESVLETRGFDPKTSTRSFFISISHPLGPLVAVRLREQLARVAPGIKVASSTRSRPIDLDRAMVEGRVDASVDWLSPAGGQFNELTLFDDAIVAVARSEHPGLRAMRTIDDLKRGEFVSLRRRTEGAHPEPGIQEWLRLELNIALEVSEILEIFMVTRQSDLFGLIPQSMLKLARDTLGLRALPVKVTTKKIAVKLIWPANAESDPAQIFIRKQIGLAVLAISGRRLR